MRLLLTISLALWTWSSAAAEWVRLLVQSSPLAGSQYYALAEMRPRLKVGDRLDLVREPGNRHDAMAVRVEWQGRQLGYVPRTENRQVAAALDGGERLSARVSRLQDDVDPWRRLEVEIYLEL